MIRYYYDYNIRHKRLGSGALFLFLIVFFTHRRRDYALSVDIEDLELREQKLEELQADLHTDVHAFAEVQEETLRDLVLVLNVQKRPHFGHAQA
eukprot:7889533-Pyramimonas_sp.AAC.1